MLKSLCYSPPAMESQAPRVIASHASPHKRSKSSVLKSIIPGNHNRHLSSKSSNKPCWNDVSDGKESYMYLGNQSILPPDHPHTRQHLREDSGNRNTTIASPKKPVDARNETESKLGENQRVTRSASFKSFVGKEKEKPPKKERQKEEEDKMKKSKSSTSIAAILSRPRSSKGIKAEEILRQKDKENRTPPSSAGTAPPPIWAQFATQGYEEPVRTTKIPLNDQFAVDEEVALYTPRDYSPSKQRNFPDNQQPTLSRRVDSKPRPKSECIAPCPTSASFAEVVTGLRKSGRNTSQRDLSNQPQQTGLAVSNDSAGSNLPMPTRGSRVMAAVAAFNGKAKELPKAPPKETETAQLDPKAIESAFESLLVSQVRRRRSHG